MRKFLLDLILVIVPLVVGGLGYIGLNIAELREKVRSNKEVTVITKDTIYGTIIRIDKRLNRIEDKLDKR